MKKNNILLYVFGSGRLERINQKNLDSKEFFYGFFHFLNELKKVEIIEMLPNDTELKKFQKFTYLVDKVLRKLSNLPFYFHLIISSANYKKIKISDNILATNDRIGLSILPMVFISKIFKKKNFSVIVMGLFAKSRGNIFVKNFQFLFLRIFIKLTNNFIFLGRGEYDLAKNLFPNYVEKFYFIPFGLNLKFWNDLKDENTIMEDYVLFVGSDGNRDYKKLISIVNENPNIKFVLVTNQVSSSDFIYNNYTLHQGSWDKQALSDRELKKIYQSAKFTILPLKESIQPSGQSVCLQSMSVGTPVMISKTSGFWDISNFKNYENIIFVDHDWSKNINEIYNDKKALKALSSNGLKTVKQYYDENIFINKLNSILINTKKT